MSVEFLHQIDVYNVNLYETYYSVKIIHKNKKINEVKISSVFGKHALTVDELRVISKVIVEGRYEL